MVIKTGLRSCLYQREPSVRYHPRILKLLGYFSNSLIGEALVVSGMQERITKMLNHADTFIFLLGDLATLEALITLASWAHLNIHHKLIGLLNVNNFYDCFIAFLNHAIKKLFHSFHSENFFLFVLILRMSYLISRVRF